MLNRTKITAYLSNHCDTPLCSNILLVEYKLQFYQTIIRIHRQCSKYSDPYTCTYTITYTMWVNLIVGTRKTIINKLIN